MSVFGAQNSPKQPKTGAFSDRPWWGARIECTREKFSISSHTHAQGLPLKWQDFASGGLRFTAYGRLRRPQVHELHKTAFFGVQNTLCQRPGPPTTLGGLRVRKANGLRIPAKPMVGIAS